MCRDLFLFLAVAFLSAHGTFSAELPSFIVLTGSSLAFRYQHDSRRIFPANGAVLKVGSGGVDDVDEVKKVVPTRAFQPKEISEEFLEDIKEGAPSDGTVMKQVRECFLVIGEGRGLRTIVYTSSLSILFHCQHIFCCSYVTKFLCAT